MPSKLESRFRILWEQTYPDIPFEEQVKVIPGRKFAHDFSFPGKVLVEINGQIWHKGGHSSGTGLMSDYEKSNLAQKHGYIQFSLADRMISLKWLEIIRETILERQKLFEVSDDIDVF